MTDLSGRTVHRADTPNERFDLHYFWAGVWVIDQSSGLWGPTGYANTLEGWTDAGWVVDFAAADTAEKAAFSPSESCGQMHTLHHNDTTGLWSMEACDHPDHTAAAAGVERTLVEWEQLGWHISTRA